MLEFALLDAYNYCDKIGMELPVPKNMMQLSALQDLSALMASSDNPGSEVGVNRWSQPLEPTVGQMLHLGITKVNTTHWKGTVLLVQH